MAHSNRFGAEENVFGYQKYSLQRRWKYFEEDVKCISSFWKLSLTNLSFLSISSNDVKFQCKNLCMQIQEI